MLLGYHWRQCFVFSARHRHHSLKLPTLLVYHWRQCFVRRAMSTNEEFQVLEVNAVPAWRGIQSISSFNITKKILDILLLKENFD